MSSGLIPSLSYTARREFIEHVAPLYREASLAQKGLLLDRMVAATGYARKYAIRLFNQAPQCTSTIHRRRRPQYGSEVCHALLVAWKAAKYICTKRLIPFLPTLVPALERHGYLHLTEENRSRLLQVSPTTADRLLHPHRTSAPRGFSLTQAGPLLKHLIPIRTFQQWNETQPGFVEADSSPIVEGIQRAAFYTPSLSPTLPPDGRNVSHCSPRAPRRSSSRLSRHERSFRFRSWGWMLIMEANSSMST